MNKYKKLSSLQMQTINSIYMSKKIIRDCERRQKDHDEWVRQRDFENNNVRIWE